MSELYAVLTGDLVKSRRLGPDELERVRDRVRQGFEEMEWAGVVGKAEFFRGDSWQAVLAKPQEALRAAIYVRAALLAMEFEKAHTDTRVSIGIGQVERIDKERVSLSTGEAFELSGHRLDDLKDTSRFAIALPPRFGAVEGWVRVALKLSDRLVRRWKPRQAEIVRCLLQDLDASHGEVADRVEPSISRQAVTKALAGAGWDGVEVALRQFADSRWMQPF